MRCPSCGGMLDEGPTHLACRGCAAQYGRADGIPVLLLPDGPFDPARYQTARPRTGPRFGTRLRAGRNLSRAAVLRSIGARADRDLPILIIGSGNQRQAVTQELASPHPVIATDIDPGADVDVFADAHALPFADGAFGAVIATAVLEHVADPTRVVAEVVRVTAPGGLVYSELPFMQQVHEGPHDFTRFSLNGHRRLFRDYDVIDSGAVAGPLTALLWAIEHVALAAGGSARPRLTKAAVRLALGWITVFDGPLARRPAGIDSASCTYVFGQLRKGGPVTDSDVIAGYQGAQRALR